MKPLSDDFLREIADKVRGRKFFREEIAAEYGVYLQTVSRWVRKARARGFLEPARPRITPVASKGDPACLVEACTRPVTRRGYCGACYYRLKSQGVLQNLPFVPLQRDRFDELYEKVPGGCWVWQVGKNNLGYGQISLGGRRRTYAHRFSYEKYIGPIPEGMDLDHLCRNPSCVNPRHLEAVTHKENMHRGVAPAMLTFRSGYCQRGHAMVADNLYVYPGGQRRECRACGRMREKNRQLRRRQSKQEKAPNTINAG